MRDKDVIQHIQDLCKERSWTYYRLAKEADIPNSHGVTGGVYKIGRASCRERV